MPDRKPITSFTGPYSYLGNFYRCNVSFEGLIYPSSEHAFQAAKSLSKADRRMIQNCTSPGAAKAAGQHVRLREGWDDMRVDVMRDILRAKFSQNYIIRVALIDTDGAHLEEGNRHGDTFWGTVNGEGENHLGILLMELREQLRGAQTL